MRYEEFDECWNAADPRAITLMANEVCSQHEYDFADTPSWEQLAPAYGMEMEA